MKRSVLRKSGVIGTVVVAVCCFTKLLVVVMAAFGLATFTGYLDYFLLPSLALFAGITVYAFFIMKECGEG